MQETKPKVLIVDDDQAFRKTLLERLELKGFDAAEAASGPDALQTARHQRIDFAVVDMRMPGMDGLVTIEKLKEINPSMRSVLLTGVGSEKLKEASEALEASYFEKNDMPAFWEFLSRMQQGPGMIVFAPQGGRQGFNLEDMEVMAAKQALDRQANAGDSFSDHTPRLIGQTPAMQELKQTIDKVAALDCTVLILGETGTGKELVAKRIHGLSNRRKGRFLAVNCGSFSSELLSNELFGHEREAFTGANRSKPGVFEAASNGTILLDEIGDTPMPMQVQLLRVLQEKVVMRVGGTKETPVDVRILAATNQSLKKKVEQGVFREDLYYRLNAFTLRIPPLRERRDDIPPLASYFLSKFNREFGKELDGFDSEVMQLLKHHSFPGNVRELENIVERATILCDKGTIRREHLPERFQNAAAPSGSSESGFLSLAELEEQHIMNVLKALGGNKNQAAQTLGISRASLWRKLKQIESKGGV